MKVKRILRHLSMAPWWLRRVFPRRALQAIEAAIREGEATHAGQIRFAVETALDLRPLLRGVSARERAAEVFSSLRVWDTERNNGVLIYLLLADHDVEILADRGIHAHVGTEGWEKICRDMEQAFRDGRFEEGAVTGIRAVSRLLAQHYPGRGPKSNELPDAPVVM
jgi:hypothetical protein